MNRNPPEKFQKGPKATLEKLNGMIESIKKNKVHVGQGIRLRETKDGVHLTLDPKVLVAAGLANSNLFGAKEGDAPFGGGGDSKVKGYRPDPDKRPSPPRQNPSPPSGPQPVQPPYWGGLDPAPDYPPLRWTTFTLPDAELLSGYSATLSAVGGNGEYTYTVTGGSLPNGMFLVNDTIVGTATNIGSYNVELTVSSAGMTKPANFTLMVSATGAVKIIGGDYIGAVYWLEPATRTTTLSVVGGVPPYAVFFLNGSLASFYNATFNGANHPRPPSMGFFPANSIYGEGITVTIGPNSTAATQLVTGTGASATRQLYSSPQGPRRWTMVAFDSTGASFSKTVIADILWRTSKYAPAADGPDASQTRIYPRWIDRDADGNLPAIYTPFTGTLPFVT